MPQRPSQYLPAIVEPRCKICNSEYREAVDKRWAAGASGGTIALWLQDLGFQVDKRSVNRHLANHVSVEHEALARIVQERFRQRQEHIEAEADFRITRDALAQALVEGGFQRLIDGDAKVPFEHALKAAELQAVWEKEEEAVKVDELLRQLDCIVQALKDVATPEVWKAVAKRARQIYDGSVLAQVEEDLDGKPEPPSGPPALEAGEDQG